MKRKLALVLSAVMSLGMAVPAMAANHYNFKSYAFKDNEGNVFNFDAANAEYRIFHQSLMNDKVYYQPLVVLKDNSGYNLKTANGGMIEHYTYILEIDSEVDYPYYHDGCDNSVEAGRGNVAGMFEHFAKSSYKEENFFFADQSEQGDWTFFMTESAAKEWDAYIEPLKPAVAELTEDMIELSHEHPVGTGVSYGCTIINTTDKPLKGSYAVVFYTPELDENGNAHAQVNIFDLDIAPGQTKASELLATHFNLVEDFEIMTGRFADEADKEEFLKNNALYEDYGRYNVDPHKCKQWLEGLGVTF